MKKGTLVRIIIAIAVGLIIYNLAGYCFRHGNSLIKEFEDVSKAEPARMKVDLSKPGIYTCDFNQSFSGAHGEFIDIVSSIKGNDQSAFAGLEGRIEIKDNQGNIVAGQDLSMSCWGIYPGWRLISFERGQYQLILTVVKPAKAYEGAEQYLVAKYALCGREITPAYIHKGIGGVLIIAGLVILIVLIRKQFIVNRT